MHTEEADRPVVHLLAPAHVGGLETVVGTLARAQLEGGQPVVIAAIGAERADVDPFLRSLGADIPRRFLQVPDRHYLRERRLVKDLCSELDPAVVHVHGTRVSVVNGGVVRSLHVPLVGTAHGFITSGAKSRLYKWLQMRAFRSFDAVVAVSGALRDEIAATGVPRGKIHVVPNAWAPAAPPLDAAEARERLGVDPDVFHLGWVGRLGREKGPDILVEALGLLKDDGLRFVCSVIGEGGLESALRDQARSLGLEDRIRWHGRIPEAARLLSAFDAVVLSSRTEGSPMVLLEAMASGVPAVGPRVGGVPDTLTPDRGYLTRPEDPAALAAALAEVATNPEEARRRAAKARAFVRKERSVESWAQRHAEVYRAAGAAAAWLDASPSPASEAG